jgi:hypothetical protein
MTYKKVITATAVIGTIALPSSALAQSHQGGGQSRGSAVRSAPVTRSQQVVGQAVPRTGPPPRVLDSRGYHPSFYRPGFYRPYYHRPYYYRPRLRIGLGFGYPYDYYGYPYTYGYPAYGYGYPYGYGVPSSGYIVAGRPYGSVRIMDAPKDAEVYADGYYVGIVDDFDGVFQHLDLEPGPHRIEIRAQGHEPITFEVRVEPGQTVKIRVPMRQ